MAATNSTNQKKAWFKQFWPWFLIALPTSAVVGCIISISLAVNNAPTITDSSIGKFARPAATATAINE